MGVDKSKSLPLQLSSISITFQLDRNRCSVNKGLKLTKHRFPIAKPLLKSYFRVDRSTFYQFSTYIPMPNRHKRTSTSTLQDIIIASTIVILVVVSYQYYLGNQSSGQDSSTSKEAIQKKTTKYGFDVEKHFIDFVEIKPNQFLSDILQYEGVDYLKITEVEKAAKDIYSIRRFKSGKRISFVRPDTCAAPSHFIYEPDVFRYIVYDIGDSIQVDIKEKEFEKCLDVATGEIKSSLWNALKEAGQSAALIDKMEDALASQVDFYHTQKGDKFKIIFEQKYIENKPVAIGNILGAVYTNERGDHYSFYYKNGEYDGYYDYDGRASTSAFLRAPVKYSRISSSYNLRRFHPIKKRTIPHYGTDYAAARGTPIISVADGVVTQASYTRGNGKYVKIKHDKTYQTQYLHMSRFASGIRKGTRVKQGQCIGYVGSTGLATGPHVCFRFWKNGKQINHRREIFPPAKTMKKEDLPQYFKARDETYNLLNSLDYFEVESLNT